MDYQIQSREEYLFAITSNGLAAGSTLSNALLRAICEVCERDAFLIAWLNRLPGRCYEALKHPDQSVRDVARLYRRRGVQIALIEVPVDHPISVFAAIALQEGGLGGPAAIVGLGADLDPRLAARQAVLEVAQVRPALRRRARMEDASRVAELVANPMAVQSLEDHALLYTHASMQSEFTFLFGELGDWDRLQDSSYAKSTTVALMQLVEFFRKENQEVLYINLTPPDMEQLGLYTVRAILPGFQPIWFGRHERRLGGERLYRLPQKLGFRAEVSTPALLNPVPHPVA
jgi:ribosomal protein S12 methylthiotransferase accessory factor